MLVGVHIIGVEQSLISTPWGSSYLLAPVITMSYGVPIIVQLICQYTFLKHIQPGYGNAAEVVGAVLCTLGVFGGPLAQLVHTSHARQRELEQLQSERIVPE